MTTKLIKKEEYEYFYGEYGRDINVLRLYGKGSLSSPPLAKIWFSEGYWFFSSNEANRDLCASFKDVESAKHFCEDFFGITREETTDA